MPRVVRVVEHDDLATVDVCRRDRHRGDHVARLDPRLHRAAEHHEGAPAEKDGHDGPQDQACPEGEVAASSHYGHQPEPALVWELRFGGGSLGGFLRRSGELESHGVARLFADAWEGVSCSGPPRRSPQQPYPT